VKSENACISDQSSENQNLQNHFESEVNDTPLLTSNDHCCETVGLVCDTSV